MIDVHRHPLPSMTPIAIHCRHCCHCRPLPPHCRHCCPLPSIAVCHNRRQWMAMDGNDQQRWLQKDEKGLHQMASNRVCNQCRRTKPPRSDTMFCQQRKWNQLDRRMIQGLQVYTQRPVRMWECVCAFAPLPAPHSMILLISSNPQLQPNPQIYTGITQIKHIHVKKYSRLRQLNEIQR